MDTPKNNRQESRLDVDLDIILQTSEGELHYKTRNASARGVFVTCPEPLALRKLVRFRTRLPDGHDLQMLGLVAHTVTVDPITESERTPGMGLQLYSVGRDTVQRWQAFIEATQQRLEREALGPAVPAPAEDVADLDLSFELVVSPGVGLGNEVSLVVDDMDVLEEHLLELGVEAPATRAAEALAAVVDVEVVDPLEVAGIGELESLAFDALPAAPALALKSPGDAFEAVEFGTISDHSAEMQAIAEDFVEVESFEIADTPSDDATGRDGTEEVFATFVFPIVRVYFPDREALDQFYTMDYTFGGMFHRTNELHPVGTHVFTEILHPETNKAFRLRSRVVKVVDGRGKNKGIQLAFEPLDDIKPLHEFVYE